MKIQHAITDRYNQEEFKTEYLEDFAIKKLILKDRFADCPPYAEEKIPLEKQPYSIAAAFGRLLSLLADKNIINCSEVQMILDDYEKIVFVREENENETSNSN
jgi:hypothetical protein